MMVRPFSAVSWSAAAEIVGPCHRTPHAAAEVIADMRLQLASRESNSRHRQCDLSAPTPPTTARCSAPSAAATGSLLEALALRCAALPVLGLPVHLARSGTPALRRLA